MFEQWRGGVERPVVIEIGAGTQSPLSGGSVKRSNAAHPDQPTRCGSAARSHQHPEWRAGGVLILSGMLGTR